MGAKELKGIRQSMGTLSTEVCVLIDVAMDLEITADWANDPDPNWGGPVDPELLRKFAFRLRLAYLKLAMALGVDPCEQIERM